MQDCLELMHPFLQLSEFTKVSFVLNQAEVLLGTVHKDGRVFLQRLNTPKNGLQCFYGGLADSLDYPWQQRLLIPVRVYLIVVDSLWCVKSEFCREMDSDKHNAPYFSLASFV